MGGLVFAHLTSALALAPGPQLGVEAWQDRAEEGVTNEVDQCLAGVHLRTGGAAEFALDGCLRGDLLSRSPVLENIRHAADQLLVQLAEERLLGILPPVVRLEIRNSGLMRPSTCGFFTFSSVYREKSPLTTSNLPYARSKLFIVVMSVSSILTSRSKSGPLCSGRKVAATWVRPLPMNFPVMRAVAGPSVKWLLKFFTDSSMFERNTR